MQKLNPKVLAQITANLDPEAYLVDQEELEAVKRLEVLDVMQAAARAGLHLQPGRRTVPRGERAAIARHLDHDRYTCERAESLTVADVTRAISRAGLTLAAAGAR
jgi:hypothetical protein